MTKILESYCTLHWEAGEVKILATVKDKTLSWDGTEVVYDFCDEHWKDINARMGELLALGTPTRNPGRAKVRQQGKAGHGGGRVQPVGDEADAIRVWVDAEHITAADEPDRPAGKPAVNPDRPAYKQVSGGQYFPIWLLDRWDKERQRRAGEAA